MTESENRPDQLEEENFKYRFPRCSREKDRVSAWKDEYDRWWFDKYCTEIYFAPWLQNARSALAFFSTWQPERLTSPKVIEAAVCNPNITTSRLVVGGRQLTSLQFALFLAHPLQSVFDLCDAEGTDEEELKKHIQAQKLNGMIQKDIDWALEKAREIIKKRKPFVLSAT